MNKLPDLDAFDRKKIVGAQSIGHSISEIPGKPNISSNYPQLNGSASRTVSKRTVQRSFHRMGFVSRRPTRTPLLNARNQTARLAWEREYRDWKR
ncbi:HTH_Tnp_Tc3_2 domain-containing protein [Trichonephila clavipes]|nr:HTH_Tnp_Tc3_2 domain-containing protein [Trichonephila clavipes]